MIPRERGEKKGREIRYSIALLENRQLSSKAGLIWESIADNALHVSNGNFSIVWNIDFLHIPLEFNIHFDGWYLYGGVRDNVLYSAVRGQV